MKKSILMLFCLSLLLLSGCANKKLSDEFTASNEIFTYDKLDAEKTIITIGQAVSANLDSTLDEFMRQNPDIQVVQIEMTGGNSHVKPWVDWLQKGHIPDVMMISRQIALTAPLDKYFEDLTSNPVVNLYQPSYLKSCTINARLHFLPCPSSITGLFYNKQLFEQHGWKAPTTYQEFTDLCAQITEDTKGAIRPWNANAKYAYVLLRTMQAFTYGEVFEGLDNRTWYNEFLLGNQTYQSHMKPFYDIAEDMFKKNLITVDDFSFSATQITKDFLSGKLAMFISDASNQLLSNGFEMLPVPASNGKKGYMFEDITQCLLKPIKKRTQKQEQAVQKFIEFMSTYEAQNIYSKNSITISCLIDNNDIEKGVPQVILDAQKEGRMFSPIYFMPSNTPPTYDAPAIIRQGLLAIAKGEMTAEEGMQAFDQAHTKMLNDKSTVPLDTIATATEDFTILETSTYFADMFREKANADIGLCLNNVTYRGNIMRIF